MKERIKIILLALFLLPNIVSAKDIYQYKDNLKIDGTYNSSTFFAGEKISSEADLNGISFMMGSTIDVDGKIDYIASMGEDITIYGDIKNDAFLLSSKISINGDLKRDAYMLADSIYIDGKINRNIYAYANKLKLENATINGNVYLRASEVVVGENVKIKGKLTINENAIITGENDFNINTYEIEENKVSISSYIISILNSTLNYIVVAILLIILAPKLFKKLENNPTYMGKGFVFLILVPIICIMFLIIPYTRSLSLILLALYIIFIYISKIFTAYVIANKYFKNDNIYFNLLFSLLIINTLCIVPIIGSYISLASMLFGLGFIASNIKKAK